MYQYLLMTGIYSVGIVIGFFLVPWVMRIRRDENEKEGIEIDQHYDQLLLAFQFMNEVEEAPMSTLTTDELKGLRDKVLHYELPFLRQEVRMYYDDEKKAFCYYSSSDIIYKYLMVVARKYVLDFECKQIFKEMGTTHAKEEKSIRTGMFVATQSKTFLEKEMNHFLYLGTFNDLKPVMEKPKDLTYSDYLKQLEQDDSSSIPETRSTNEE